MDKAQVMEKLEALCRELSEDWYRLDSIADELKHQSEVVSAARTGIFIIRDMIKELMEEINNG